MTYNINDFLPKLAVVTPVNMCTGILKDRAFALLFDTNKVRHMPPAVFLSWMGRDVCTILGGLVLPSRVKLI